MIKLILQHLKKRRIQTVSAALSVAVSAGVLFALLLLRSGVTAGIRSSSERMGADLMVIPAEAESLIEQEELLFGGAPVAIYMPMEKVLDIMARPGIEQASAQFFGQTLDEGCCSAVGATRLVGYDDNSGWLIHPWLDRPIELGQWQVFLGSDAASAREDAISILGHQMQVMARLDRTGTSLDRSIIMRFEDLRLLMEQKDNYDHIWAKYGPPDTLASAVLLKAVEGRKQEVANGIMSLGGVRVLQAADIISDIQDQMSVVFSIMFGAGLLLAGSSILQLFARFYAQIWDRKGEWGLYRAIGASRRDLKLLIFGESLLLTLMGAAVGLPLGGALYGMLLKLLNSYDTFPFIPPTPGATALGAAAILMLYALIALAAAALPAYRSSRIDPSSAMAMGDID